MSVLLDLSYGFSAIPSKIPTKYFFVEIPALGRLRQKDHKL
jgi:hypothetical protein